MNFSDQTKAEAINWFQTTEKITWDNIRCDYVVLTTGGDGRVRYSFVPAFARRLESFTACPYAGGGALYCTLGFQNVDRTGFTMLAWWDEFNAPLASTFGIYFLAFGR